MPTDDYIKRNDVKTAVFAWYVDAIEHHHKKYLDEVIAKIPAADVELVRHGKWIPIHERRPDGYPHSQPSYFWCNLCKSREETKRKFCHECGAKMDEEDGNDKENL